MALDTIPKQEGGKLKAVASGTLPSGQPVVVNSDGTVSVVVTGPDGTGSETVFEASSVLQTATAFDSNSNRVVIAYRDVGNSGFGTAVVGTVSGTSISFGTPVVFKGAIYHISMTFDSSSNKIVISFRDDGNSYYGTSIVGTVSGTSISFGTSVVFESAFTEQTNTIFDPSSNKVVIAYKDAGNGDYGTCIVGTVSGTSISFGTAVVFEAARVRTPVMCFDSNNNKVVIAYEDSGSGDDGTAIVGTVSGTSISFGTPVVYDPASTGSTSIAISYDSSAGKVVISFPNAADGNRYGYSIVGTVSGTSISFGTAVLFDNSSLNGAYIASAYNAGAGKVVIAYYDVGDSNKKKYVLGTVSGTSISFTSPVVFDDSNTNPDLFGITYNSVSPSVIIAYKDDGNSSYGTSIVIQTAFTTLTSENYIGMSTGGAVADTGNATVDIVGTVNKEQSGLTPGQQYYVQTDGTLSETPADPSVLAGTAVSATKMVVKS